MMSIKHDHMLSIYRYPTVYLEEVILSEEDEEDNAPPAPPLDYNDLYSMCMTDLYVMDDYITYQCLCGSNIQAK